ncbi:aldolase [Vararia minispora EC-137]|uniref:Aldolase n=1 Tax=Vararia minispora EC-137 TaxID=1314806 RepID=A0ACB8QYX3_9AGAM|nr:aldolase [Vararia minispora EC-137]
MSLLASVRARVVVDVDSMDPAVATAHVADGRFSDMTSNQAIANGESARPEQAAVLAQAIDTARKEGAGKSHDEIVQHAVDLFTVLLAKNVLPHLTGRVHAQTAPATAYDTAATIAHAARLVDLFAANGVPADRVCIKIPATPESLLACAALEKRGIRTLATTLFSVPQAIAAHQARCLYVAPYFNELPVHFEPAVWKPYADTAREHPMSPVILHIVATYRALDAKTLVMPASIVTAEEVLALVSLSPHHLTLSPAVLNKLAALPASPLPDALPLPTVPDAPPAYLESSAAPLRDALAADTETTRKLADALRIFSAQEAALKERIGAALARATDV